MYSRNLKAYLAKIDGKFIITDTINVYEVNEVGARIFDLCNGKNTLEDIAFILAKKYEVNKEMVLEDVKNYVSVLLNKNFIFKD
ncbi:PqqD family protein [Streptococcus orisasini]